MVSNRNVGRESDGDFGNNTKVGVIIVIVLAVFIVFPNEIFFERFIGVNGMEIFCSVFGFDDGNNIIMGTNNMTEGLTVNCTAFGRSADGRDDSAVNVFHVEK